MTIRRTWAVIPGLTALAATAVLLSAYSGASSPEGYQPEQPIAFPHQPHVTALQMNCLYCHFSANKSPDPGMPAVSTCMGCHLVIGPNRPARQGQPARQSTEIAKLQQYWNKNQPVPWVRVHKVPDYVFFPHMRHVNAGVTCQACHGEIQDLTEPVFQAQSLSMGWCLECHVGKVRPEWRARYDCSVCHY